MDNEVQVAILAGRLNGVQRNHLKRLLNMQYTPRELAEAINVTVHQVYRIYIHSNCPIEVQSNRHILINGVAFKEWYLSTYKKIKLAQDEAFCKTCRSNVKIVKPVRKMKNRTVYDLSVCPKCGRRVSRFIARVKVEE